MLLLLLLLFLSTRSIFVILSISWKHVLWMGWTSHQSCWCKTSLTRVLSKLLSSLFLFFLFFFLCRCCCSVCSLFCFHFCPSFGCCQSWPRQDLWWMMTEHKSSLIHPASDKLPGLPDDRQGKKRPICLQQPTSPSHQSLSLWDEKIHFWVKFTKFLGKTWRKQLLGSALRSVALRLSAFNYFFWILGKKYGCNDEH